MNKFIFIALLGLSTNAFSVPICDQTSRSSRDPWVWEESDFSEKSAMRSFVQIEKEMKSYSTIGNCELPNTLAIIEGYLLKKQALQAISNPGMDPGLVEYYKLSFCAYLQYATPCE